MYAFVNNHNKTVFNPHFNYCPAPCYFDHRLSSSPRAQRSIDPSRLGFTVCNDINNRSVMC